MSTIRYIVDGEPHAAEVYNRPIRDLANSLGNSYSLDVGTTAGTIAAGDDSRIVGAATKVAMAIELDKKADKATMAIDLNKKADKDAMVIALDGKVDKKPDHSLYPDADKAKVATMASGATKNRSDQDTDNMFDLKLDKVSVAYTPVAEKVPKARANAQIDAKWVQGSIVNESLPDLSLNNFRTTYTYNGVATTLVSSGSVGRPPQGSSWYNQQFHSGNKTTQLLVPYAATDGMYYRTMDETSQSQWMKIRDSSNTFDIGLTQTTARTSLGLGNAAYANIGTAAGTVAAGNDPRFAAIGGGGEQYTITVDNGLTGGGKLDKNITISGKTASTTTTGVTRLATVTEAAETLNWSQAQTPAGTWNMIKNATTGTFNPRDGHVKFKTTGGDLNMMWVNIDFESGTATYVGYFPFTIPMSGQKSYAASVTLLINGAVPINGVYDENVILTVIDAYTFRLHITSINGSGVATALFTFG